MGGWILSVKIVAASATVFSSAMALWLATPPVTEFLVAEGPRLYKSIAAWLTPPYLYFIINGIIISIAATSRFQKTIAADNHPPLVTTLPAQPPSISAEPDHPAPTECISNVTKDVNLLPEFLAPAIGADRGMELSDSAADMELEDVFVISRSSWLPRRKGTSENLQEKSAAAGAGGGTAEKQPVSARLCSRRKSIKASPEGKALRVTRPKKHDTLESTWRTITDGRPVPLARHLKKADTWDTHAQVNTADPAVPDPLAMRKLESFAVPPSTTGSLPSPASGSGGSSLSAGKIRREPSLGQDDLNRRVEAFIKKFNEEIRLQRKESLQQYMDMINRSGQ